MTNSFSAFSGSRLAFHATCAKGTVEGELLKVVAKENGRVIGGVVAVWTGDTEVELKHVAIVSEAQGKGTGRRLIESVLGIARPRGVPERAASMPGAASMYPRETRVC